jgi:uncharacterized protein (DUF427 family)
MNVDLRRSGYADRPDYRVDLLPRRNRVVVRKDSDVIAETLHPLLVDEQEHGIVVYVPRADVRMERLEVTDTVTYCPFKGSASHWRVAGTGGPDVAWSYEEPYPEVGRIEGYVAFYQDRVQVEIGQAPRRGDRP